MRCWSFGTVLMKSSMKGHRGRIQVQFDWQPRSKVRESFKTKRTFRLSFKLLRNLEHNNRWRIVVWILQLHSKLLILNFKVSDELSNLKVFWSFEAFHTKKNWKLSTYLSSLFQVFFRRFESVLIRAFCWALSSCSELISFKLSFLFQSSFQKFYNELFPLSFFVFRA